MHCTNCGAKNSENPKFCYSCGTSLTPPAEAEGPVHNENVIPEEKETINKNGDNKPPVKKAKIIIVIIGVLIAVVIFGIISLFPTDDSKTIDLSFLDDNISIPWILNEEESDKEYNIYENGSFASDPTDEILDYVTKLQETGEYNFVIDKEEYRTAIYNAYKLGFVIYEKTDEDSVYPYYVYVEARKDIDVKLKLSAFEKEADTECEPQSQYEAPQFSTSEDETEEATTQPKTTVTEAPVPETTPPTQYTTENKVSYNKKVAEPLSFTSSGKLPSADSGEFQSLSEFCEGELQVAVPVTDVIHYSIKFTGEEKDLNMLLEYSKLLEKQGMYFTRADENIQDFRGKIPDAPSSQLHYSYYAGFKYTGNTHVEEKVELNGGSYSLYLQFNIEKSGRLEGAIYYDFTLKPTDLGYRKGGVTKDNSPSGPSAAAGLIRTANDTYETDDNRLYVYPGTAVMLDSGVNTPVRAEMSASDSTYHLYIYKNDGERCTAFSIPKIKFKSGALFKDAELAGKYSGVHNDYGPDLNSDYPIIFRYFEGKYYSPSTNDDNMYKSATARIMYLNESEDIVVFYIYSEFMTKQEILCAYRLSEIEDLEAASSGSSSGSGSSSNHFQSREECSTCQGNRVVKCHSCNSNGQVERYDADSKRIVYGDCSNPKCHNGYKDCPNC